MSLLTSLLKLLSCILLVQIAVAGGLTDKATGISFPSKCGKGECLFGVGVRRKGPIKVCHDGYNE